MRDHVIWSDEHQMFWRPDGAGYTKRFWDAGLYTAEEVEKIVRSGGMEKKIAGLKVGVNYKGRVKTVPEPLE
jgi:hypothetical protein